MNIVQLLAVEKDGLRPLPTPPNATRFDQLFDGMELGVYSAMRTFSHNQFLYLEAHIQRTQASAALLGWRDEIDETLLRRGLHEACTHYPLADARVRFDFLASPPRHLGTDSRLMIALIPFSAPSKEMYERGVKVAFAPDLARQVPLAKTADFAKARSKYAVGGEIYEFMLVGEQGEILEGTGTNFYGVLNGVFHTAGEGVLAGITRKIILDLAESLEIPVRFEPITVARISELSEAAISSSSRALLPVVQIENQVVGNGRPGPICQQILAAYNAFVAREVKTAV